MKKKIMLSIKEKDRRGKNRCEKEVYRQTEREKRREEDEVVDRGRERLPTQKEEREKERQ